LVKNAGYQDWPGGFRSMHATLDEYDKDSGFITWEEALNSRPPPEEAGEAGQTGSTPEDPQA
jgi:hypothetical protein